MVNRDIVTSDFYLYTSITNPCNGSRQGLVRSTLVCIGSLLRNFINVCQVITELLKCLLQPSAKYRVSCEFGGGLCYYSRKIRA